MGLAAGIAPGPLLTMVISETIKGNKFNGIAIALAPLITDIPIVFFSIIVLNSIADTDIIIALLSIFGALFLVYMGIQNFRFDAPPSNEKLGYGLSLKYGVIANVLSPHPYIFWITIGAPTFIKASANGNLGPFSFIFGFYLLLVGSKAIIAIISGKIKGFLQSNVYKYIMNFMGLVLFFLAALMVYNAIALL